jgi:hypothetical protein
MKGSTTFWLWVLCSVGGTAFFMFSDNGLDLASTAFAVTVLSAIIIGAVAHAVRGKKA